MSSDRAMDTTIMTGSQRVTRAGYGAGRDEAERNGMSFDEFKAHLSRRAEEMGVPLEFRPPDQPCCDHDSSRDLAAAKRMLELYG